MKDTRQLLTEYVADGSEEAFRELVARHIDLVYSTAVRLVEGDAHLAQDIAQTVFINLARQARTLPRDVALGGWLHRDTCFVASKLMRGERRRRFRERQTAAMNALPDHSAANLAQIAPLLDEAVNKLGAANRQAILLRFYERLDFRAVGRRLGTDEDAAQKRVSRALEKLHSLLKTRGLKLTVAAFGTALAGEAVTAAPAGLAGAVACAALAGPAAGGGAVFSILKTMAMTKFKLGVLAALVAGSLGTSLLLQNNAWAKLRAQDEALARRTVQLVKLQEETTRLSIVGTAQSPADELRELRAETKSLQSQTNDLARLRTQARKIWQAPPREPNTPIQWSEMGAARQFSASLWLMALKSYARQNQGRLPASFAEAKPYWPNDAGDPAADADAQYEMLYHGSLDALTNRDVLLFREKRLWVNSNGKPGRFSVTANANAQYGSVPEGTADGDFNEWEQERLIPVSP